MTIKFVRQDWKYRIFRKFGQENKLAQNLREGATMRLWISAANFAYFPEDRENAVVESYQLEVKTENSETVIYTRKGDPLFHLPDIEYPCLEDEINSFWGRNTMMEPGTRIPVDVWWEPTLPPQAGK